MDSKSEDEQNITEILELLSTGVGHFDSHTNEYKPGQCVLKSLKRIKKLISLDRSRALRKHIVRSKALANTLIPAFCHYVADAAVLSACIEIFFLLTDLLEVDAKDNMDAISISDYYSDSQIIKAAFLGNNSISVIMKIFKEIIVSVFERCDESVIDSLEVYLLLFRNLTFTYEFHSGRNFFKNAALHDDLIVAFHQEHVLQSVAVLATKKYEGENEKIARLILEIVFNVLRLETFETEYTRATNSSLLDTLRSKERRRQSKTRRNSAWNSQYSFSLNNGKKLLTPVLNSEVNETNLSFRKRRTANVINSQKRVHSNDQTRDALIDFISQLVNLNAFECLVRSIFNQLRNKTALDGHKLNKKVVFVLAIILYKTRTILFMGKSIKSWEHFEGKLSFCLESGIVQALNEFLHDITSAKTMKFVSLKWKQLDHIVMALRETTKFITYGAKSAFRAAKDTKLKRYSQAEDQLLHGNEIFKCLLMLLREYKVTRNSKEYLYSLVELTHLVLVLGKDAIDNRNDSMPTEEVEHPRDDYDSESSLLKAFSELPPIEVFCNDDFKTIAEHFCNNKIISNYITLLSTIKTNPLVVNKCVENFMRLVGTGLERKRMFYNISYLETFERVLNSPNDPVVDPFKKLVEEILSELFVDLEKFPFVAVDSLFAMSKRLSESISNETYGIEVEENEEKYNGWAVEDNTSEEMPFSDRQTKEVEMSDFSNDETDSIIPLRNKGKHFNKKNSEIEREELDLKIDAIVMESINTKNDENEVEFE